MEKGVVQQIFDLDDGTAVKLTIAEYFLLQREEALMEKELHRM